MIKDGWHKIGTFAEVYTENGIIKKAIKKDNLGRTVPASVYKPASKKSGACWTRDDNCKYSTFIDSRITRVLN